MVFLALIFVFIISYSAREQFTPSYRRLFRGEGLGTQSYSRAMTANRALVGYEFGAFGEDYIAYVSVGILRKTYGYNT
jgi:hypothetical protein